MRKKYSNKTEEDFAPAEGQGEESVADATVEEPGVEVLEASTVETMAEAPVEPTEAPAAKKTPLLKRAVYKTFYAASFGTVFSALLVKKLLIPKNSLVDAALHDGAAAACEAIEEKERMVVEAVKEAVQETEEFFAGEAPASA